MFDGAKLIKLFEYSATIFRFFFKKIFICFKINELETKKFFTQSTKKVIFHENSICERFFGWLKLYHQKKKRRQNG